MDRYVVMIVNGAPRMLRISPARTPRNMSRCAENKSLGER